MTVAVNYPAGERDVVDLGSRHFLRPLHELVRYDEPIGSPVMARSDTPVKGLLWWHDCTAAESSWMIVLPGAGEDLTCPFCGDHGRIRRGHWVKVKA